MTSYLAALTIVVAALGAGCGDDPAPVLACDQVWIDGADTEPLLTDLCMDDGTPTYWPNFASFDCAAGGRVAFNGFGWWHTDDMILSTDWNSENIGDIDAACGPGGTD